MSKVNELMVWKFQGGDKFGFFIPDDREYYGGDFYISKENIWEAKDWDKVEARELKVSKWKKPEAKIISVKWKKINSKKEIVEWIYSWWDGNYWFIDVEWLEKWYFVYGDKKAWAKDWDKVRAELVDFKWKKEAIVLEIMESEEEIVVWTYKDNDRFGFVLPDSKKSGDIFIAWSRKNWALDWDTVEVKIIKRWGKNPEGVIKRII